MALSMNNEFANRELSSEELETIAAGNIGGAWNNMTQANSVVTFVSGTTGKTVVAHKCGAPGGGIPHYL